MRFCVGLTGGIGSGKSAVADEFAALGAAVVDTDVIARELTRPQAPAMAPIAQHFGPSVLNADGSLNRDRMRTLAFSQPEAKAQLEAILHPMIRQEALRRAQTAASTSPYVLFVVPLLAQSSSWRALVQRILLVDCTVSTQIERVQTRPGWTAALAHAAIGAQATRAQRLMCAHDVLVNESNLLALPPRIALLHQDYLKQAS
ncbi:MAG TPA: dephospho-CoA kinase [Burkholderiaceae bacterium]|nr:dephospho-CoA kinase [Burkholderiaceae bacterium]